MLISWFENLSSILYHIHIQQIHLTLPNLDFSDITRADEFENLQKQKQTKKIEKCKKVLVPAIGQYF